MKITVDAHGVKHKVIYENDDLTATDYLEAFVGLMYAVSFSEETIRDAIVSKAMEMNLYKPDEE